MIRFLLICLTFIFLACGDTTKDRKSAHTGKPGEIYIILPNNAVNGPLRDSITSFCTTPFPGLPQYEYNLDPIYHSQSTFSGVDHLHRNLLFISIADKFDHQNPNVKLVKDQWAKNQLVFTLRAKNEQVAAETIAAYGQELIKRINEKERQRTHSKLAFTTNKHIQSKLANDWGLNLTIPSDFSVSIDKANCVWLSRERTRSLTVKNYGKEQHDITQGIVIYKYRYQHDSTFTTSLLQSTRDSILGKFVQSKNNDGIKTETRYAPVLGTETSVQGKFAFETRFLWRFDNPIMGGPAISIATTDPSGQWVICIEGFVFAPKFDKREYLREMEAIVYSLSFPAKQTKME